MKNPFTYSLTVLVVLLSMMVVAELGFNAFNQVFKTHEWEGFVIWVEYDNNFTIVNFPACESDFIFLKFKGKYSFIENNWYYFKWKGTNLIEYQNTQNKPKYIYNFLILE